MTHMSINTILPSIQFGKQIPAELFSTIAEQCAQVVAASGGKDSNKRTQLRKFYDELVMWHDKVYQVRGISREETYNQAAPFIQMLNAKAAYAQARNHVDDEFKLLFSACVKKIDSAETLQQCKLFFEAFMGYYRGLRKD